MKYDLISDVIFGLIYYALGIFRFILIQYKWLFQKYQQLS